MAVYCIGDLHGRFDLFMMLLRKINFSPDSDKLYLLGDVIDWNYGGVEILDYLMQHQDSCILIRGNHESNFLHMTRAYDIIMSDPVIKEAVKIAVEIYSEDLFAPVYESFVRKLSTENKEEFYKSPTIKKWLKSGAPHIRQKILDAMIAVAVAVKFDRHKMDAVKWVLAHLRGRYKTKPFVQELLTQKAEHYEEIKQYVKRAPRKIEFDLAGKRFHLLHSKKSINPNASKRLEYPHANTCNITYVFGHDPVPLLHREIQGNTNSFSFNYRRIFSWIDNNQNRYYNLDLASNPIAALKLNDMSEYYVGSPLAKHTTTTWEVPDDAFPTSGTEFEWIDWAQLGNATFDHAAVITKIDGCQEFIIGISGYSHCIYYAHISWLDYRHTFVIQDWLENQSMLEIIEKVREDFGVQHETPNGKKIAGILQGAMSNDI